MKVISGKGMDGRVPGDGLNHKIGATGVRKLTMGKLVMGTTIFSPSELLIL